MKNRKPLSFGLLVTSLYDQYENIIWTGARYQTDYQDDRLICFSRSPLTESDLTGEKQRHTLFNLAGPKNIDALIVLAGSVGNRIGTEKLGGFLRRYDGIPLICIGLTVPGYHSIIIDNRVGMYNLVSHMIEVHGYKDLAFVKGPDNNDEARERFLTFTDCMRDHNLPVDPELVCEGDLLIDSGPKAIRLLLDTRKKSFDAILFVDDFTALNAMSDLRHRRLRIPEDIPITGFDDIEHSQSSTPPLTTVRQPLFEIGRLGVRILTSMLQGEAVPEVTKLPTHLMIRESCGCTMEKLFHAHRPEGADALREDKEVEEIAVDILEELDRLYGFIFTPSESEVLSRRLRCLLNAIVAAVHDDAQLAPLLETVEVLATTFFDKGITVSLWDGIINSIFKKLACVAALADSLNQLEMLRIKALLSLFQTGSHFQAQKRIFMELENENVQYICDLLVVSFDLGQIKKILDEKLVAIHIPETYISFYEPGQKDASLLYSYFGRDDDPMAKEVFPASELIPGGIAGRSGSYCVMPMGTDKEEFGFVVFKTADMQGSKYDTLADKIASAVNGAHLVEKVRQQNVALSKSEENLRITLNSIGDAVVVTDTGGTITSMNPVAEELTGWMFMQALGRPLGEVFNVAPDQSKTDLRDMMDTVIGQGIPFRLPGNCILVSKENSEIRVNYSGAPLRNTEGSIIGSVIIFRDITEQFIMEEKLRQTQKMDAIGQLAGGVAHDFNNMLAGIMGYAELIALQTGIDDPIGSYARKIFETAQNTAELNKKLLTYSRKAKRQSLPVDVHVCINDAIQILEHSLDRRIIIHRDMKADVTVVRGDASQVQNAILNLALNARDAMHEGGDLTFSSVNVVLDREFCETSPFDLHPGLFIEISVCDTGIGMDPETQSKIFHPFFTTKEVGKGTGLGLAAVYGIVRDHRGAIKVYSELNKGTVFKVYLPADPTLTLPEKSAHEVAHTGTGCVLVIDDEKIIRDVLTLQLREMGYSVLTAQDGIEGVTTYQNNCSTIDMVILDIVMPKMSGPDTFTAIRNIDPDAKIVLLSGFSRDANLEDMLRRGAIGFIQKPFKRREIVSILAQYIKNED